MAELLLAFTLLTLATLAILGLYTSGIRQYRRADRSRECFSLAQSKMEELMNCNLASVVNSNGYFPDPDADFAYRVDVTNFDATARRIHVEVTHLSGAKRDIRALRAPNDTPLGLRIFMDKQCHSCHHTTLGSLGGTGAAPPIGNLGPIPGYEGVPAMTPRDYLSQSVRDPVAIQAGGMPSTMGNYTTANITDIELDAIYDWLNTLPSRPDLTP
jgi:hypothetical protein